MSVTTFMEYGCGIREKQNRKNICSMEGIGPRLTDRSGVAISLFCVGSHLQRAMTSEREQAPSVALT